MDSDILGLIDDLRIDRLSGASSFLNKSIKIFETAIKTTKSSTVDELIDELLTVGRSLIWSRPAFSSVINPVLFLLGEAENIPATNVTLDSMIKHLTLFSEELLKQHAMAADATARNASRLTEDVKSVLVHSNSGTVKNAFLLSTARPKVFCTESRPGFEGRKLAHELSSFGYDCTVITDAAVAHHMDEIEMVLVGGDSLFVDGSVVNKIGTRMIAIIANHHKKQFFVACDSWKILSESARLFHMLEEWDPQQVLDSTISGRVRGRNVSFDVTDPELITGIASEYGMISPTEVSGLVRESGATSLQILSSSIS